MSVSWLTMAGSIIHPLKSHKAIYTHVSDMFWNPTFGITTYLCQHIFIMQKNVEGEGTDNSFAMMKTFNIRLEVCNSGVFVQNFVLALWDIWSTYCCSIFLVMFNIFIACISWLISVFIFIKQVKRTIEKANEHLGRVFPFRFIFTLHCSRRLNNRYRKTNMRNFSKRFCTNRSGMFVQEFTEFWKFYWTNISQAWCAILWKG